MRRYLEAIAPRLTHFFISVNYRGVRTEGGPGVEDVLAEYFQLTPTPAEYRRGLRLSWEQYDGLHCRPVFIGTKNKAQRADLAGRTLREVLGRVCVEIGPHSSRFSFPPILDRIRRTLGGS